MEIFKLLDDSSLSRKYREKLFKRREILIAACRIFSEKGFELTTLDEIAEASEYGKGTLYNYFQNKEDIYLAVLESILIDYLTILNQISTNSNDFLSFMSNVTEELFKYSIENETPFLLLTRLRGIASDEKHVMKNEKIKKLLQEINNIYKKFIDIAFEQNYLRKIDFETLIVIYRTMTFSYIYHLKYCKKVVNIDIKKESQNLLDIFLNGIKNK